MFATQCRYGDHTGGWEFSGGKAEERNPPEDALVREIREELDVRIGIDSPLTVVDHDYDTFHLHMSCFVAHTEEGHHHPLEHSTTKWLEAGTIDSMACRASPCAKPFWTTSMRKLMLNSNSR